MPSPEPKENKAQPLESESKDFRQFILEPHFSIPQRSDFLDSGNVLELTPESRELFALGKPGQAYTGLLDLKTLKVHLMPSFNKGDGLRDRRDKNGNKFSQYVVCKAPLGQLGNNLHKEACKRIEALKPKQQKSGKHGKVLGFGIWKAGYSVKLLHEMPSSRAGLIPDEYLVIKSASGYALFYIDEKRNKHALLEEQNALNALPSLKNAREQPNFTSEERSVIEQFISEHHLKNPHRSLHLNIEIKLAKNRSTSQNKYALQYAAAYSRWFHARNRGHTVHDDDLIRELPLEVFQKIMDCIFKGLGSPPVPLSESFIIPEGTDGIHEHFNLEKFWKDNPQQCLLEYGFFANDKGAIMEALRGGASLSKSSWIIIEFAFEQQNEQLIPLLKEIENEFPDPEEHTRLVDELGKSILQRGKILASNREFQDFCLRSCGCFCNTEDVKKIVTNLLEHGNKEHLELLRKLYPDPDGQDQELLWNAVYYHNNDIALELLKAGVDPNYTYDDQSVLWLALDGPSPQVIDWLLLPSEAFQKPVLWANTLENAILEWLNHKNPTKENIYYLKLLLENNPDQINLNLSEIISGNCALHWAIINNWPNDVIMDLCRLGADPTQENHEGNTAYALAIALDKDSLAVLLKQYMKKPENNLKIAETLKRLGTFNERSANDSEESSHTRKTFQAFDLGSDEEDSDDDQDDFPNPGGA